MNIQISVVIWTVICFCLLLFILTNLLFKPVLSVMDKRNKKIGDAKKKKQEAAENAARMLKEQEALADKQRESELADLKAQAEILRLEGKKSLDEARKERLATVEEYRAKTEAEFETEMKSAESSISSLADAFLEKLFAN
ncbi:MAG: hypothetical protein KBS52_02320 [Clostridiales bacterium]|nr:hypothetical protein [Candidatus Equinaster intestinalis]